MAGSRERGRYGHTSGLDIDRLMSEFRAALPPEPAEVGSEPEPKEDRRRWRSREGRARRITRAGLD